MILLQESMEFLLIWKKRLLFHFIMLIREAGILLELPAAAIAASSIYFMKFYHLTSLAIYEPILTAQAALFLAAKAEEQPRRMRDVVTVVWRLRFPNEENLVSHDAYWKIKEQVNRREQLLLRVLGFDTGVDHAHKYLFHVINELKGSDQLASISVALLNDSLGSLIHLQYPPLTCACAAIYVASELLGERNLSVVDNSNTKQTQNSGLYGPSVDREQSRNWWELFAVQRSDLEAICHVMLDIYAATPFTAPPSPLRNIGGSTPLYVHSGGSTPVHPSSLPPTHPNSRVVTGPDPSLWRSNSATDYTSPSALLTSPSTYQPAPVFTSPSHRINTVEDDTDSYYLSDTRSDPDKPATIEQNTNNNNIEPHQENSNSKDEEANEGDGDSSLSYIIAAPLPPLPPLPPSASRKQESPHFGPIPFIGSSNQLPSMNLQSNSPLIFPPQSPSHTNNSFSSPSPSLSTVFPGSASPARSELGSVSGYSLGSLDSAYGELQQCVLLLKTRTVPSMSNSNTTSYSDSKALLEGYD